MNDHKPLPLFKALLIQLGLGLFLGVSGYFFAYYITLSFAHLAISLG